MLKQIWPVILTYVSLFGLLRLSSVQDGGLRVIRQLDGILPDCRLTRIRDYLSMDDNHVVSEGVTRRRR